MDPTLNGTPAAQCPPSCSCRFMETQTGPVPGADPAALRKEMQFSVSVSHLNQVSEFLLDQFTAPGDELGPKVSQFLNLGCGREVWVGMPCWVL